MRQDRSRDVLALVSEKKDRSPLPEHGTVAHTTMVDSVNINGSPVSVCDASSGVKGNPVSPPCRDALRNNPSIQDSAGANVVINGQNGASFVPLEEETLMSSQCSEDPDLTQVAWDPAHSPIQPLPCKDSSTSRGSPFVLGGPSASPPLSSFQSDSLESILGHRDFSSSSIISSPTLAPVLAVPSVAPGCSNLQGLDIPVLDPADSVDGTPSISASNGDADCSGPAEPPPLSLASPSGYVFNMVAEEPMGGIGTLVCDGIHCQFRPITSMDDSQNHIYPQANLSCTLFLIHLIRLMCTELALHQACFVLPGCSNCCCSDPRGWGAGALSLKWMLLFSNSSGGSETRSFAEVVFRFIDWGCCSVVDAPSVGVGLMLSADAVKLVLAAVKKHHLILLLILSSAVKLFGAEGGMPKSGLEGSLFFAMSMLSNDDDVAPDDVSNRCSGPPTILVQAPSSVPEKLVPLLPKSWVDIVSNDPLVAGGAQGGNGPWRVKSNSQPAVVSARPVPESNSFVALQCPKNDTPSGPSDGVEKNVAIDFTEPDLGPTLNGVVKDIRILTPSVLEWENRGESLLKNDESSHECSSRDMRGIICVTPLPEGDQMGGEPPSSTNLGNPPISRSSRRMAQRVPTSPNVAGCSNHIDSLPPVLVEKDDETPLVDVAGRAPCECRRAIDPVVELGQCVDVVLEGRQVPLCRVWALGSLEI
ncbi:hypothetical protein Nepgr_023160 [Nepenthes gracilis]|uniref:Uncharacterized protein n=1 Tax=Nepenthes gracilis TaxID=150966 RepID=A0AAD3T075_NEPGR|nr:hypothetical protein Nepgr_023160 [Nepenthes gracilis]